MFKIELNQVKNYSFTGYIKDSQLSDAQLKALGLKREPGFVNEIKVIGDFIVNWDDDIPLVEIDTISVIGTKNGTTKGYLGYNVAHCEILPSGHPRQGMVISTPQRGIIPIYNTIELNDDNISNIDELCDDIAEQGDLLDWYSDKESSLIDHYYDTLMDR